MRLHGAATEDDYGFYREGWSPEAEYRRMATDWGANVVGTSIHASTGRDQGVKTLALLKEHVGAASSAGSLHDPERS